MALAPSTVHLIPHCGASKRLLTAYQEELISLDELRSRMPAIRDRRRELEAELRALEAAADCEQYLRIGETLASFRERLRAGARTLDVVERQKVLRSLVKQVLVGDGEIPICHSMPVPEAGGPPQHRAESKGPQYGPGSQSYLLRWGRRHRALRRPPPRIEPVPILHHSGTQPLPDQPQQPPVPDPPPQQLWELLPVNAVKYLLTSASSIQLILRLSIPTDSASSASCAPRPGRNP